MTRKKVKLSYISNDTARKATFKKRRRGLLKKVSELSTLCGIEACAIIFSPYSSQAEVWPSPTGVQHVVNEFKNMPVMEQCKKMVNQETFLRQRILKANEQLRKLQRDNREKEMTRTMFQSLIGRGPLALGNLTMNIMDLNDLGWLIDQNVMDICKRMDSLRKLALAAHSHSQPQHHHHHHQIDQTTTTTQPQQAPTAVAHAHAHALVGAGAGGSGDHHGFNQTMTTTTTNMHNMAEKQPNNFESGGGGGGGGGGINGIDTHTVHQMDPWFMNLMNQTDDMGFVLDDMIFPFGDHENQNVLWSNAFFP